MGILIKKTWGRFQKGSLFFTITFMRPPPRRGGLHVCDLLEEEDYGYNY